MPSLMAFIGDSGALTCLLFFVVVVDKLCIDAITLIDFIGGWGQRWVSAQALTCLFFVFLFYLIIFLHFD